MSQASRLYALLKDYRWHSTVEIMEAVYGGGHLGLARVGARIHDIKRIHGVEIEGKKDPQNPSIYLYRLVEKEPVTLPLLTI